MIDEPSDNAKLNGSYQQVDFAIPHHDLLIEGLLPGSGQRQPLIRIRGGEKPLCVDVAGSGGFHMG